MSERKSEMSNQLRPLVVIIVLVGALLYIGGIVWGGVISLCANKESPANIPPFVSQAITAIGTALATHFGALFGISQFTGGNPRPIPKPHQVQIWATLPHRRRDLGALPLQAGVESDDSSEHRFDFYQIAAAYLYFASLILAGVFWAITGFSEYAADAIRNMSFALIGVIAGVIAVTLNVRRPPEE